MLEASTKAFYDVDTATPALGNPAWWLISGLSQETLGTRLAIVITDRLSLASTTTMASRGYNPDFNTGRLVLTTKQAGTVLYAKVLGKVNICPIRHEMMSFEALKQMKGAVLADEVENGLLGKLYGGIDPSKPFVHPDILDRMPRRWHLDATALNYELDGIFASGTMVEAGTVGWVLSDDGK